MDPGIADAINRRTAQAVAARMDGIDVGLDIRFPEVGSPWYHGSMAATIMGENPDAGPQDLRWLVSALGLATWGTGFDGTPADADWDNLYSHLRAEVVARRDRDPEIPCVAASTAVASGV
jgi:hypothetical protein